MSSQTVMIMAGGTGGHVFPALATAKALQHQGYQVHWLGTANGIEYSVVPQAGFELHCVKIEGLRGKGFKQLLHAPMKLVNALLESRKILREVNPIGVLGMGGFVTGPGGLASWLMGLPLVIHEQNAVAGLTNKLLSKLSKTVLVAFPGAFPGNGVSRKLHLVGNPIRSELSEVADPQQRAEGRNEARRILILGGSLGALALNETMPKVLKKVAKKVPLEIVHQAGKRTLNIAEKAYAGSDLNVEIKPFIDDMAEAYSWADLVICRAGALTVSEIMTVGVASVLVPFPHAVDDHQTKNAEYLVQAKAGLIVQQNEIAHDTGISHLAETLIELLQDRSRLIEMANNARTIAKPNATQEVTQYFLEACGV